MYNIIIINGPQVIKVNFVNSEISLFIYHNIKSGRFEKYDQNILDVDIGAQEKVFRFEAQNECLVMLKNIENQLML